MLGKIFKPMAVLVVFTLLALMTFTNSAFAASVVSERQVEIEYLDDGYYLETVIEDEPESQSSVSLFTTTKTITKTKTTYYKNSAGSVMWSISIKATFTYNGSTSTCTSCSHSTTSPGSTWSIKSSSSSRSGNSATAKATAVQKGIVSHTVTKSVTIKCSATGTVS